MINIFDGDSIFVDVTLHQLLQTIKLLGMKVTFFLSLRVDFSRKAAVEGRI